MVATIDLYSHAVMRCSAFGTNTHVSPEVAIIILSFLDWRQLVQCTEVSRFWRQLICGTLALQYKIELGADGLVDGTPGAGGVPAAIPERLRALRRRRDAWNHLAFRRCVTMPMHGDCEAYELSAGVFVKTMHPDSFPGGFGLSNPTLGSRLMHIALLPGAANKGKTMVREDVGVLCSDVAIDPTQDLMVMVEQQDSRSMTVHLRTISMNEAHPAAALPTLVHPMKMLFDSASIHICDDVVAAVIRVGNVMELMIWEWTTGQLLVGELHQSAFSFAEDFSLISNYAFMTTCLMPQGSIKVYTFRPLHWSSTAPSASIAVDSDLADSAAAPELTPLPAGAKDLPCTSLLLPALQPGAVYTKLDSRTASFVAGVPAHAAWYPSEDVRVHLLSVFTRPSRPLSSCVAAAAGATADVNAVAGNADINAAGVNVAGGSIGTYAPTDVPPPPPPRLSMRFEVVVRNKILLWYADAQREKWDIAPKAGMASSIPEVPWETWGPKNTRWLQERSTNEWLRNVHGARVVHTVHSAWLSRKCQLKVLDFNVHPGRLRTGSMSSDENKDADNDGSADQGVEQRVVFQPSVVGDASLFCAGGVESALPYHEARLRYEVGPYSGFMIDEERVVGLPENSRGYIKDLDVFTF